MYLRFTRWLEARTSLPIADDRELIIGAYGALKQFIPQITELFRSDKRKFKMQSGKESDVHINPNPGLLVVWDNKRKILMRGTNNCAVCKNYDVKKSTCEIGWEKESPKVTQQFAMKHDIGGCVGLDFLSTFGTRLEQSKKYEGLQYALARGYIFRYTNGQIDPKPIAGPFEIDAEEEEYKNLTPWERKEREEGY